MEKTLYELKTTAKSRASFSHSKLLCILPQGAQWRYWVNRGQWISLRQAMTSCENSQSVKMSIIRGAKTQNWDKRGRTFMSSLSQRHISGCRIAQCCCWNCLCRVRNVDLKKKPNHFFPPGYPVSLWPCSSGAHYRLVNSHKLSLWFWSEGATSSQILF